MWHGVSYDGTNIWIATGDTLNAIDPASGKTVRTLDVPAHAGTAFDGQHLFQISGDRIQKVDPETGRVVATHPDARRRRLRNGLGGRDALGRAASQPQDPSGRSARPARSFAPSSSNRFVTGVTWVDGELWHGTWEAEQSELRRIDPQSGRGPRADRHAARASACRGSSPTAATRSSAAAAAAGK